MIKNFLTSCSLACVGALGFVTLQVSPASADSVISRASAFIQQQIIVAQSLGIDFGKINFSGVADILTIAPDGTVTSKNGSSVVEGEVTAGGFNAAGTPNANIIIEFTKGNLTGPGVPMEINNFTHDAGQTASFDTNGNLEFKVGADLNINDSQVGGQYSGTYQVSISYP